jgi:hypothetical protein
MAFKYNPFTHKLDIVDGTGGAVIGPGSSVVGDIATWNDTTGTTLADSGKSFSTDGTLSANSDDLISTQRAVKTYADTKQPLDATLTSIALLGSAADKTIYTTGVDTWAETDLTAFMRSLLDDSTQLAAQVTLGLEIGTNVQAWDATLQSLSALGTTANRIAYTTNTDVWAETVLTPFARTLLDDVDAATAATTIGLGTANSPTFTGATLTGSGLTPLTIVSTDAGATAGPIIDIYRNSVSPTTSDVIGQIQFNGQDSGPAKNLYASITAQIDVATGGSENSRLTFSTQTGGALTTQLVMLNTGCQVRGNNTNTAPPAGFLGYQVISTVAPGSAVAAGTGVTKTVTSITLPAGIYNMDYVVGMTGGAVTGTYWLAGVATTTDTTTGWVETVNATRTPTLCTAGVDNTMTMAGYRVTPSTSTTYYLTINAGYTIGSASFYGTLRATVVG